MNVFLGRDVHIIGNTSLTWNTVNKAFTNVSKFWPGLPSSKLNLLKIEEKHLL